MRFVWLCLIALIFSHAPAKVLATDIAGDVQSAGMRFSEDGGYWEFGLGIGYIHNPYNTRQEQDFADLYGDIEGSAVFRYRGLFLEAVQDTQDGVNLGYNLWQDKRWSVDFLAASANRFYDTELDTKIQSSDDEETRNRKLYNRHSLYMGTGVRVSHYIDDYVIQYRLVTDTLDDNGLMSTLRLGRGWQYRNWNFHAIASVGYTSETTNNYWFGVDSRVATEKYPAYRPGSSVSGSLQLGLAKPLTEKWVVKAFAGWIQHAKEARNSPFVDDSDEFYWTLSINRVFSWEM
ncbi:MipA/OmpV family protein [Teredinibacter turnerae]|uniref:MipA/OmpV family protein n=1 Tax=Teredinibacter turnerae TaxID=2426 RepID=UPI0030CD8134